jgi:hypothetical protein
MPEEKTFWATVLGVLTGIAAIITAIGGVVAIYYNTHPNPSPTQQQSGDRDHRSQQPATPFDKTSIDPAGLLSNCSPTYPETGELSGTRTLYFDADESARGAAVYLNGKCQGYLESSGRLRDKMLVNVPPGKYIVVLKKKGYSDFQSTIEVPPSSLPDATTPKMILKVRLVPS